MLELITDQKHRVVIQATSGELLDLRKALGKFSQRDFARMGLLPQEVKVLELFHADLHELTKVLVQSVQE